MQLSLSHSLTVEICYVPTINITRTQYFPTIGVPAAPITKSASSNKRQEALRNGGFIRLAPEPENKEPTTEAAA